MTHRRVLTNLTFADNPSVRAPVRFRPVPKLLLSVCLTTPLLGGVSPVVYAQTSPAGHQPRVCTGYNRGSATNAAAEGSWGSRYPAAAPQRLCPANHVFTSASLSHFVPDPQMSESERRGVVESNCCPLPAEDILTAEHSWTDETCPEDSVVTGSCIRPGTSDCPNGALRCTKINPLRYQLGADSVGTFWGFSSRSAFPWREEKRIKRSDIPLGMRYGAIRSTQHVLAHSGCVGEPFGNLLTGITGWRCLHTSFRQLQFLGISGDPAQGSPVTLFPACSRLSDIESADPQCILDAPVD